MWKEALQIETCIQESADLCEPLLMADIWTVVWLKGEKYPRKYFIGVSSLDTGGQLIGTFSPAEVNPAEISLYRQPLEKRREFDLTKKGIAHLIPVGLDVGSTEVSRIESSEGKTLPTVQFHLIAPHRIENEVYASEKTTIDVDLDSFLDLFAPEQEATLFENIELRTGQQKTFLLLPHPSQSEDALAIFFEDFSHRGKVSDRRERSSAAATSTFNSIVSHFLDLYPQFRKIVRAVEGRKDYKSEKDTLIRSLMKLQVCSVLKTNHESLSWTKQVFMEYTWKKWEKSALKSIGELLVTSLENNRFTVPPGEYDTLEQRHVLYERTAQQREKERELEKVKNAERNRLLAAEKEQRRIQKTEQEKQHIVRINELIPTDETIPDNMTLVNWIAQLRLIGSTTESAELIHEVCQHLERYAADKRVKKNKIPQDDAKKILPGKFFPNYYEVPTAHDLLRSASRELRERLLESGKTRLKSEGNFDVLTRGITYETAIEPDPYILNRWITILWETGAKTTDKDLLQKIMTEMMKFIQTGRGKEKTATLDFRGRSLDNSRDSTAKKQKLFQVALAANTFLVERSQTLT